MQVLENLDSLEIKDPFRRSEWIYKVDLKTLQRTKKTKPFSTSWTVSDQAGAVRLQGELKKRANVSRRLTFFLHALVLFIILNTFQINTFHLLNPSSSALLKRQAK